MRALSKIYAEFRAGKIAYLMLQALPDTQVRVKFLDANATKIDAVYCRDMYAAQIAAAGGSD